MPTWLKWTLRILTLGVSVFFEKFTDKVICTNASCSYWSAEGCSIGGCDHAIKEDMSNGE